MPIADTTFIPDLATAIEPPTDGILSRTIRDDDAAKVVLFGFSPGQALSEHTASVPAIVHVLRGKADLTLGEQRQSVGANAWAFMPANLPHSIHAHEPTVMVLVMLKRR